MTRLALLAVSLAVFAAAPARASRGGKISVSAQVVSSAVVRPVELVSVRRVEAGGRARMVASVRQSSAGPVLIEQRGGAAVQLAGNGGRVSVVLPDAGGAEVIVTVFSDGAPGWQRR